MTQHGDDSPVATYTGLIVTEVFRKVKCQHGRIGFSGRVEFAGLLQCLDGPASPGIRASKILEVTLLSHRRRDIGAPTY